MLKPITLLLNKVKGNAKHLYPGEESKIDNLTPDTVQLENFTVVSAYRNEYKTDLTDPVGINAVEQKWASAQLVDLTALQNTFALGGLTELLATHTEGGSLSINPNAKNVYIALEDVSTDALVISKVSEHIGYELTSADCKITRPVTEVGEYISVAIKNPYIASTVYVYKVTPAEIKVIPGISIGRPTYAATGKTGQLTLMELLMINARNNGWQTEFTEQEFDQLMASIREPYILYDVYANRYDDGNVSYRSGNGCFFPSVSMGYSNLSYTIFDIDRSDYIDFIDLDSIGDLDTVTVPGFYRIKSQFIYKHWLMVDDFETVNKDLFNVYSSKLWLTQAELGYGVNGQGDYGTPSPVNKNRGYYNMNNILMHDFSIYIRRIGE